MCVNNLSKVAHDSAAAGIEPAFSSWTTATLFSPVFQPATTVSAQHSCTFGGRLIAT